MKLLTVESDGYTLKIEPEIYTIGEFANLVETRKKNLDLLYKELGYIYFHSDMASDFQFQTDENERRKELIKYLDLPTGWKVDRILESAIDAYKYLSQSTASRLLQGTYIAAEKIKNQLETIDLNERDKNGKPVWNIKQIYDVINALPKAMESIHNAEKQYIKSQEDNIKLRGNKSKSVYDDIDLKSQL